MILNFQLKNELTRDESLESKIEVRENHWYATGNKISGTGSLKSDDLSWNVEGIFLAV